MNNTRLIVLRGPSGSGKSSIAKAVRLAELAENRKIAYVEQDYFRRIVLKEKDIVGGFNGKFIKETVMFLLHKGYDVIVEGIFDKGRYQQVFEKLVEIHPSRNYFFYFDVSFEETLKRHETKPNRHEFGEKEMMGWYKDKDLLDCVDEIIISEKSDFDETINTIRNVCKN